MARYSIGFTKASITAAGAIIDVATASTDRAKLVEVGVFVSAMTGTTPTLAVGLTRTTAVGTRTTPTALLAEDGADPAATSTLATAWSVAPTLAASPLRRILFNAIGQGVIWTWPIGAFVVPVSSSVTLNAVAVAGTTPNFTLDGYVVVDE